jgi:hypothetical protein
MNTPKYDPEIGLRSAVIGFILGVLAGPKFGLGPELSAPLGVILGALYDFIAFKLKTMGNTGAASVIAAFIVMFAIPAASQAQSIENVTLTYKQVSPPPLALNVRYSAVYDGNSFQPVIGTQIGTIRNVAGKGIGAEVWFPVLGMDLGGNRPNLGAAVVVPWKFADNAYLLVGALGKIEAGQKARISPILGIEIRG